MSKKIEEVVVVDKAATTKVASCKCKHTYQDDVYGQGKRLFSRGGSKDKIKWSCTVCGSQL
jgi:hypothetical protein